MFTVAVIDWPWSFKTHSEKGQGRSPKYEKLGIEYARAMPIPDVMRLNSAIIMWTSGPYLFQAHDICRTWGYRYSTYAFVWAKLNKKQAGRFALVNDDAIWKMTTGYWTRANCEIALLYTRGHPKRVSKSVRQLIVTPYDGVHSRKPEEAQDRIEKLLEGPYLEVFARRYRPGWTCIGNELDGLDIVDSLYLLRDGKPLPSIVNK